jgi:hypothetical protein
MKLLPALLLMLACVISNVQAQSIWRCGADGRQFSDKPCEQGRPLETLEARPNADLAAAQDAARREAALAAQLAKERQQRETQAPMAAAGISNSRAAKSPAKPRATEKVLKKSAKRHQPAEDGIWRAVAPSSRQTKG